MQLFFIILLVMYVGYVGCIAKYSLQTSQNTIMYVG